MSPTPKEKAAAKAPRRQSCDRCYGQKLRCTRAGNGYTGACNRCIRQGVQCVYSSSLPKGRPSMYRLADTSTATLSAPGMPIAEDLCRRHLASPPTIAADTNASANTNTSVNDDAILDKRTDMPTSASMSTWPWLPLSQWNDTQVDGSEQDSSQPAAQFHRIVNPHTDSNKSFLDAFPSVSGSVPGRHPSTTRPHERGHGHGSSMSQLCQLITQLSQLSTRLSQQDTPINHLPRPSCTPAETAGSSKDHNQVYQSQLLDETAFKSIAAWLVQISANVNLLFQTDRPNPTLETATIGDTLRDVFSASHYLLEILRRLQVNVVTGTSAMATTVSTSISTSAGRSDLDLDFWASIVPQSVQLTSTSNENMTGFEQGKGLSSQCPNTVIHHLVITCHTLLLNIYIAVLITLQRNADLRSFRLSIGNVDADADVYTTALADDIRLVLVVQLCTYLTERQHKAVDLYLLTQSPPSSSQPHNFSGSRQPSRPTSTSGNQGGMSDLEVEVRQRLARLQQTLGI